MNTEQANARQAEMRIELAGAAKRGDTATIDRLVTEMLAQMAGINMVMAEKFAAALTEHEARIAAMEARGAGPRGFNGG